MAELQFLRFPGPLHYHFSLERVSLDKPTVRRYNPPHHPRPASFPSGVVGAFSCSADENSSAETPFGRPYP
jgi:hypothetical protein